MWPLPKIEPMVTIHTMSIESGVGASFYNGGNIGMNGYSSSTWAAGANVAVFVPFTVSKQISFSTLFTVNGTVVNGNIDIGVYAQDGTKIVSTGSTAQSGTSAIQLISCTATTIGPGVFYLAMASSSTTGTFATYIIGQVLKTKFAGVAQMASALPLPATATLATIGQDSIPLIGLSTRTSI